MKPGIAWRVEMLGGLRAVPTASLESGEGASPLLESASVVEQFRTHKAALLLARLALFPQRAHGREELADLLWPDAPTERGRAYLTKSLVYLRQALREPRTGGLFIADHRTVRITRGLLQTDVSEWETAAAQALASIDPSHATLLASILSRYTGDLLPGFYDDWVCDERSRLMALRDALQTRLESLSSDSNSPVAGGRAARPSQRTVAVNPGTSSPAIVNAPLYLTRFFGRDLESESVCRLLHGARGVPPARLITLLGMGGIGKTRLALQIGRLVLGNMSDGAPSDAFGWAAFVSLADARTGEDMENGILHALGIQSVDADGLGTAIDHLNGRAAQGQSECRLLLLLDNLEQLGEAAAHVVSLLLGGVPGLTILATSRQPVRFPGEQEIPLGALPCSSYGTKEGMRDDIRLFVDRAHLVRPTFVLTSENKPEVTRLCALLEGVPLALELAAAWMRILPPAQIAERLSDRFTLLALRDMAAPNAIVPQRHRSLQATIAWSYDLLEPALQSFFARLSIFRGGWTAEAAQAVTEVAEVHEPLLLLAERSLITLEDNPTGKNRPPRYRMLESLREFADAQLCTRERESLAVRHARFFDGLSRAAAQPKSVGTQGTRPLLPEDRENLRAAIVSSLPPDDRAVGLPEEQRIHGIQIVLHSVWIWTINELADWLNRALAALPLLSEEKRPPLKAGVLFTQGSNVQQAGDFESARHLLEESRVIYDACGDQAGSSRTRSRLGNLAYQTGDIEGAIVVWTTCLEEAQHLNDEPMESALLSNLAVASPNLEDRRRFGERTVALSRLHMPDSHVLASSLNTLGNVALEQRDFQTARACLEEARDLARAAGASGMLAIVLANLVGLAIETGDRLDGAQEMLDAAQATFEELGAPTRVAEVQRMRFRLALAQGDADQMADSP